MFRITLMVAFLFSISAQYTSQTFPDPRLDPLSCRMAFPGPVCDPSAVLTDQERNRLVQKINKLHQVTQGIKNTSPSCVLTPERTLEVSRLGIRPVVTVEMVFSSGISHPQYKMKLRIKVAIMDKIGNYPNGGVDVEKFANNLKRRYQNFQDIGLCDTDILIVNARQDRQVFTVAGRDALISKEVLQNAFEKNIAHFKSGRFALGLEGMVEILVAAYSQAHIVQVTSNHVFGLPANNQMLAGSSHVASIQWSYHKHYENEMGSLPAGPTVSGELPFRAAGLPNSQRPEKKSIESINIKEIPEEEKVWVSILEQAAGRCGADPVQLPHHVRAVVEEAMALSLLLIQDSRYNAIEEEVETHKEVVGIRDRAWKTAQTDFLDRLIRKYASNLAHSQTCPSLSLRKHLMKNKHHMKV